VRSADRRTAAGSRRCGIAGRRRSRSTEASWLRRLWRRSWRLAFPWTSCCRSSPRTSVRLVRPDRAGLQQGRSESVPPRQRPGSVDVARPRMGLAARPRWRKRSVASSERWIPPRAGSNLAQGLMNWVAGRGTSISMPAPSERIQQLRSRIRGRVGTRAPDCVESSSWPPRAAGCAVHHLGGGESPGPSKMTAV